MSKTKNDTDVNKIIIIIYYFEKATTDFDSVTLQILALLLHRHHNYAFVCVLPLYMIKYIIIIKKYVVTITANINSNPVLPVQDCLSVQNACADGSRTNFHVCVL